MRVLVAPDSFGGSLRASEAAGAIAEGWTGEAVCCPLSDGGPGFLEVLASSLGGELSTVETLDPLLRPVAAEILRVGETSYVESAQACGLHLLDADERDPGIASSAGVGRLLAAAREGGAATVVVGLGGSGTNDGGRGALAELGVSFLDADGHELPPRVAALARLGRIEARAEPWTPGVSLLGAFDVENPLLGPAGATAVFAPQKGAHGSTLAELEEALARFATVAGEDLAGAGGLEGAPGAGAAGGLGYGLLLLGGSLTPGADLVLGAVGFDGLLGDVDFVLTGEGTLDAQSLSGKVVSAVAARACAARVPCVAIAGEVTLSPEEIRRSGLTAAVSLSRRAGSVAASIAEPARYLRAVTEELSLLATEDGIEALSLAE